MKEKLKFYFWAMFMLVSASTAWAVVYNLFQYGKISWYLVLAGAVLSVVLFFLQRDKDITVDIGEYKGKAPQMKSRFFWGCTTDETGESKRSSNGQASQIDDHKTE